MASKICPKCQFTCLSDYIYCPLCGEKLMIDEKICPNCQTSNSYLNRYCFNCGELLEIDPIPPDNQDEEDEDLEEGEKSGSTLEI